MNLTLEQILKADDCSIRKVACPEWGGDCYVRTLTADERDKFEQSVSGLTNGCGVRAALVGIALCDHQGTPLHPSAAQVKALGNKASGPVDRLVEAIMELNAMRKADVEKLEKNSETTDKAG
jgi:hypothetical protein